MKVETWGLNKKIKRYGNMKKDEKKQDVFKTNRLFINVIKVHKESLGMIQNQNQDKGGHICHN